MVPNGQPTATAARRQQGAAGVAEAPKWADVLGVLRDDMQRAYRIDIETNSTVEPEAVEDQKNIADVMNALGQFLNSVSPLVAKGVMPFQAAQSMMLAIVRRFRFGPEIEDYIKQMKSPPPPPDPGQAEAQKHQAEQAASVQKEQIKAQPEGSEAPSRREAARLQAEGANTPPSRNARQELAAEETARVACASSSNAARSRPTAQAQADREERRAGQDTDLREAALAGGGRHRDRGDLRHEEPGGRNRRQRRWRPAGREHRRAHGSKILDRQDEMLAIVMGTPLMPNYDHRCDDGHEFERFLRFASLSMTSTASAAGPRSA
jgi:hypothetical protein